MFCEQQRGGLCRMHSINNFIGSAKLNEASFKRHMLAYDAEHIHFGTTCAQWDIIDAAQQNVVSYIMRQFHIYVKYYAINQAYQKVQEALSELDTTQNCFFVFNDHHIWIWRRDVATNQWYKIDSIGGVRPVSIASLNSQKNVGLMIPVQPQLELMRNITIMSKCTSTMTTTEYLRKCHAEKKVMGDLEIPLALTMSILDLSQQNPLVECLIQLYKEFYNEFAQGQCNNLVLILHYIPPIISELMRLKQTKNSII
jgi:hypothetical protein